MTASIKKGINETENYTVKRSVLQCKSTLTEYIW